MLTTSSVGPKSTGAPPEERFWKRYSPHGELPLSGAGSFAVHALVFGSLVLWAVYLAAYFVRPSRPVPVDPVRLIPGGGRPDGQGDDPGGRGPEAVADGEPSPNAKAPPRPELRPPEPAKPDLKFDRVIAKADAGALARLNEAVRRHGANRPGPAARRGVGDGPGPGKRAALTRRQQRMMRWSLVFNTQTGADYVRQLRGLGAILAIPVKERPLPEYKVVRDLTGLPAQLLDEDLSGINRIFWLDNNERSVREVMSALRLPLRPGHFVAFMPLELEHKLFELEKAYRGLDEDRIAETRFRVLERNGRFDVEVIEQKPVR